MLVDVIMIEKTGQVWGGGAAQLLCGLYLRLQIMLSYFPASCLFAASALTALP